MKDGDKKLLIEKSCLLERWQFLEVRFGAVPADSGFPLVPYRIIALLISTPVSCRIVEQGGFCSVF